tara:strand:+ start:49 stop:639 length:591 start_codon:yes stop_codon:yes gene_type:complete
MSKSYDIDYHFGQQGSAHCKTAASIIPPKGMVIVAIQFLADNTPTVLRSERSVATLQSEGTPLAFFNTEYAAHNNGDAQQACVNKSSDTTHALSAANSSIKVGMQVFSNTENLLPDILVNTPPCLVETIADEVITFNRAITCSSTTLTFSQHLGTGDGGEDASGITYPKGLTIYGRWLEVKPSADADGGIIAYFGQ